MERLDVLNMFTYKTPDNTDIAKIEILRNKMKELALMIHDFCPDSPARDYSIQLLHTSNLTANAAIVNRQAIYKININA